MINMMFGTCIILFLMVVILSFVAVDKQHDWMELCKKQDGVPAITARGPDVCIKKSAVIDNVKVN
jgi:hypothetical protein